MNFNGGFMNPGFGGFGGKPNNAFANMQPNNFNNNFNNFNNMNMNNNFNGGLGGGAFRPQGFGPNNGNANLFGGGPIRPTVAPSYPAPSVTGTSSGPLPLLGPSEWGNVPLPPPLK